MDDNLFRKSLLEIPPWFYYEKRLSKYPNLLDAFGMVRPDVLSEITGVIGACVINLNKSEVAQLLNGEYDKVKQAMRDRVEKWSLWDEPQHKKAALAHIDQLSDDGFRELAENLWSPKLSFNAVPDSWVDTEVMPVGDVTVVHFKQTHTDVPTLFLINASGHLFYNAQLEGLACLPKGTLEFRGKSKPAQRDAFVNFMNLVRANAAGSEVNDMHRDAKPEGDYQTLSIMAVSRLLYNVKLDNATILNPIAGACVLRSFILGQPLFFANASETIDPESPFMYQNQKDFDMLRANIVFGMVDISEPTDAQRDEVLTYLSLNADLLAAKQRNFASVTGFTKDLRGANDNIVGHLSSAATDMLNNSKILQELYAQKPELKELLATTDEGYIKGFQKPDKLLAGLVANVNPKDYPTLNLALFSAVFNGLFLGQVGPLPPRSTQKTGWLATIISRLQR